MDRKLLLRNRQNGAYYAGNDGWVPRPVSARAFQQVDEAIRLARESGAEDLELVVLYQRTGGEVRLPIPRHLEPLAQS